MNNIKKFHWKGPEESGKIRASIVDYTVFKLIDIQMSEGTWDRCYYQYVILTRGTEFVDTNNKHVPNSKTYT